MSSLRPFFAPRSVAVVGASRNSTSIGYRLLAEIIRAGFTGNVFPVNPGVSEVQSLRSYASVLDIPGQVDLAVIVVPAAAVPAVVDDCAKKQIAAVVVISAGFSETNAEGKERQRQLVEQVRNHGMRMIGPNCMGLLNTDPSIRLNASFSPVFPPVGPLAMSSQSGALGLAVLALATKRNLGLSTFVSVGNKADVSGNDLLEYWEDDAATKAILLYLESFGNPRRFAQIARRVGRTKPIIAVKAGRSSAGSRAAGSHTAALAASDTAVDALFRQTGVIRTETLEEMFDVAVALSSQPEIRGRRIGIVTNAGGPGILCADACAAAGLTVPELGEETKNKLRGFLPATAGLANPIDMVASANPLSYRQTIEAMLLSDDIDALVVMFIPLERTGSSDFAAAIREGVESARASGVTSKPILACVMSDGIPQDLLRTTTELIPAYGFPEIPAKVLSKCADYGDWKARPLGAAPQLSGIDAGKARSVIQSYQQQSGTGWLPAMDVEDLLRAFGISLPPRALARTGGETAAVAERLGFPVAVKLASTTILHKSDVGGVQLNLNNGAEAEAAFNRIRDGLAARASLDAMDGVVVEKMMSGGVELMAGITTDPSFGPLIAFGLGGIYVEILGDVRFRLAPLTEQEAHSMIREIRGFKLLQGYRGHPPADVEAVKDVLLRVSRLAEEFPEITELDLNPILALPPGQGCYVLDARIHLNSAALPRISAG